MKLKYKNPGFEYSLESIAECIKKDEFWSEAIFYFFPELLEVKGLFNKNDDNKCIIKAISKVVEEIYKSKEDEINIKVTLYQKYWDQYEELINERFSSIFQFDTNRIFNELICNITLNPISPRYLKEEIFDTFYMNSEEDSLGNSLHEISHYLWFYLWNKKYMDSYENYEAPSLIWILSEAVVEQIINRDKELSNINNGAGAAYSYFYKINVKNKLLYDYLNDFYENNSIDLFMDKSYKFMLENEEEIIRQIM